MLVPGNPPGRAVVSEGDAWTGQHRGRRIKGTVSFSDCRGKEKDRKSCAGDSRLQDEEQACEEGEGRRHWSYLVLLTVPTLCGVTAAVHTTVRLLFPAPTLPVPTPALAGTLQNTFVQRLITERVRELV